MVRNNEEQQSKESGPYLLLPPLSPERYAALKGDISQRGVMVPLELDECGNVLDGKHRLKACHELGIRNPPFIVRAGLNEQQKFEHLLRLNLTRRHVKKQDLKKIAANLREKNWTQDQIAKSLNVTQKTVSNWLSEFRNLTELTVVTGRDGKLYPVKKKERTPKLQLDQHAPISEDILTLLRDFRKNAADIGEPSIDLILTHSSITHPMFWNELGIFAERVLKPGKLLVIYAGQECLPQIMEMLSKRLQYVWTGSVIFHESRELADFHIRNRSRLLLFFAAPLYEPSLWFKDTLYEEDLDSKESGTEAALIEQLTNPGDIVCDPCGDDRVAVMATRLKRGFIGSAKKCIASPEAVDNNSKESDSCGDAKIDIGVSDEGQESFENVVARIRRVFEAAGLTF